MPIEITMPKLTDTMSEATLAKWLKKEGDKINPGDMIAEVETDKATQELESFDVGTLAKIVVPEGGKTLVGAVIAVLAAAGEDAEKVAAGFKTNGASPAKKEDASKAPKKESGNAAMSGGAKGAASPADENAQNQAAPVSGGAEKPEAAAAVEDHEEGAENKSLPEPGKQRISPLARKIAEEKGVDVSAIRGTGPDGRVIKRDVLEAAAQPKQPVKMAEPPAKPAPAATSPTIKPAATGRSGLEQKQIPLSNMRQTIARRLLESKQKIPHFYVSIDVVMDKLLDLRKSANEQLALAKLTVTDFIARAAVIALTRVPAMNASFSETAITQHGSVSLGIAVALDDGLMVPVIRNAESKGIGQLSVEIKSLADLAKSRKLKIEQMTGGTFTISNLGMYGVKDFMAIINPPESAILAVGGTESRAIVKDGQLAVGQVCTLTLSADHRVVDGATGAQFLSELKKLLENPLSAII